MLEQSIKIYMRKLFYIFNKLFVNNLDRTYVVYTIMDVLFPRMSQKKRHIRNLIMMSDEHFEEYFKKVNELENQ